MLQQRRTMLASLQADVAVLRKKTEFALSVRGEAIAQYDCVLLTPVFFGITADKTCLRKRRGSTGDMQEAGGTSGGTSHENSRAALFRRQHVRDGECDKWQQCHLTEK